MRTLLAGLAIYLAADPAGATESHRILSRMAGCWSVTGQLEGKSVTNLARAEFVLDGKFLRLNLVSTTPGNRYEALIFFGEDVSTKTLVVHWLDVLGAQYSRTLGEGVVADGVIDSVFAYPDGRFENKILLGDTSDTWRMVITSSNDAANSNKLFSDYIFSRRAC